MFRDAAEFKDFIRNVELVSEEWSVVIRQRRAASEKNRQDGDGVAGNNRKADGYLDESTPQKPARKLSDEELKKILETEETHDKEMFERKFGKKEREK